MFDLDIGWIGWLFVACIAAVVSYVYMTWPYNYFKNRGIPGPKPTPFLGNLGDFGKKPFWSNDVEWTKQYGKVFGMFSFGNKNYMISDREIVKEICIKEFDNFCDRSELPNRGILKYCLIDMKGQGWRDQRHQLSPYFSTGTLKMSAKPINKVLDNLIACLEETCDKGEMFEAKNFCQRMTMDVICCTAFGIEVNCCQNPELELLKQANKIFSNFGARNKLMMMSFVFPMFGKLLDFLHVNSLDLRYFEKLTRQLIAKRKEQTEKNGHDFVNILLKERKGANKGLTDDEIIANAILFLLAAYDTTAGTLSLLLYNFAVYPECQEKAFQEIQDAIGTEDPTYENVQKLRYLEMCLDECLRLFPLAPRIDRVCIKDTVIKGLTIEKGMTVMIPIWQLHRDPEAWDDPDTFIPERFTPENKKTRDPSSYMPFGAGPRHCIGMRLALLELRMATVRILTKFKIVKNEKTEVPLQFDPKKLGVDSKNGIWLSLERRC